jgi:hypothetical protein
MSDEGIQTLSAHAGLLDLPSHHEMAQGNGGVCACAHLQADRDKSRS